MDVNDRYLDTKSIRLRANNSDPTSGALTIPGTNTTGANVVQMQFDKPNGVGTVSFYYGSYSSHSGGVLFVEYSTDGGITWLSPENNSVTSPAWAGAMQEFSAQINVQGNIRIRIIKYKQSGTTHSVNIDNICVTDYSETGYVNAPTFSPIGGAYINPVNVTISSTTENAIIRYTLDGSEPTESSTTFTTPLNINSNTTIKAKAWKEGLTPSNTSTATYTFPIEVANIAEFKAANPATSTIQYKITGDVTFVYRSNRYIYIKDASAGLLVFDNTTPVITNEYNNGDIITGGIIGTCTIYNGQYELIPTVNPAAGIPGTPVTPIVVTMENLIPNFTDYESQLIRIMNVTFAEGTFTESNGSSANIKIYQDADSITCRNHFNTITGYTTIPEILFNVTGFAIPFVNATTNDKQIAPRDLDDISEGGDGPQLTGSVIITGSAVFGETLQTETNLSSEPIIPDLGELTYQWLRGSTVIGTNTPTYTIVQADIGYKIKVKVVAANCSGSVTSAETETVAKAQQTPPDAPTLASKTDKSITLNEIQGCEYHIVGGEWQISPVFTGLTSETTYSFEARKAETATHLASAPGPSADFTTEPLGIGENDLSKINVYSFQNSVYIKNETTIEIESVEIWDLNGRLVYQDVINQAETRITLQVTTGIYNVVLQGRDVARKISTKVLIMR
jgi:hypothetical protein